MFFNVKTFVYIFLSEGVYDGFNSLERLRFLYMEIHGTRLPIRIPWEGVVYILFYCNYQFGSVALLKFRIW